MNIKLGNFITILIGVPYFIFGMFSPLLIILMGGKVAWENVWLGPAMALPVLLFCKLVEGKPYFSKK
jgi:hypothetical protein